MATFGIESGSVDNRAFSSSTGVGKKFKDWVVKTPANHGPGWFIYDDQSGITTDPYIVVCNQSSPTVNSKAMFIRFTVVSASENVTMKSYLAWDSSAHTGLAYWQGNTLNTKTGALAYYFRGGADLIMVILRDGTSITSARVSRWTGIWDGTKGTEPESTSGVASTGSLNLTDPGGYLSITNGLTGYKANLDGSGNLYFSIVLVSGSTYFINIYKDSARTQLIGHTANFTNTATGSKTITADNASGLGGIVFTLITVAAATNISCRFLRIDLGSGQGAAFRVGGFYFIVDFQTGTARINYVQVESKSGDMLVFAAISSSFPPGAYISPYPHRWLASGSGPILDGFYNPATTIPYVSSAGNETNAGANYVSCGFEYFSNILLKINPDDDGVYGAQQPWVYEQGVAGNRYWGKESNVILGNGAGLSAMIDRRIINGVAYVALSSGSGSTIVPLVLDTESLS